MNSPARDALGPLIIDLDGESLSDDERVLLRHPGVGGVIFFARNFTSLDQLRALSRDIHALRPGLIRTADTEGGRVQRFRSEFTRIPTMQALGRLCSQAGESAAVDGARDIAWLMASELRGAGVDMPLAPVVDIGRQHSEVIGDRAFADNSADVCRLARAFTAGLVEAGSAATAKHFPGHGAVAEDSHACLPVDDRPWSALAEDMTPYKQLIADGLDSIMMAHVRYPQIDDRPASLSRRWISDILRGELAFDGCVFCDDLSMNGAAVLGDHRARALAALEAGCDFLPVCHDRYQVEQLLDPVCTADTEASRTRRERLRQTLSQRAAAGPAETIDESRRQSARALCERLNA